MWFPSDAAIFLCFHHFISGKRQVKLEGGQKVLLKTEFHTTLGDLWCGGCDPGGLCDSPMILGGFPKSSALSEVCRTTQTLLYISTFTHPSLCLLPTFYSFSLPVVYDPVLSSCPFLRWHDHVWWFIHQIYEGSMLAHAIPIAFHPCREALADWRSKNRVGRARTGCVLRRNHHDRGHAFGVKHHMKWLLK